MAVQQFAFGLANPIAAWLTSLLGCLLAVLLAVKARTVRGRDRVRLLVYAGVSLGATGIWLAHTIALLGFAVPGSIVRYDPLGIAVSLAVAVVTAGEAVLIIGTATAGSRWWRLLAGGVLLAVGVAGTHYVELAALRVGGSVSYDSGVLAWSLGITAPAAGMGLCLVIALRGLRGTIAAAAFMATAVVGMHYVAMSAITVLPPTVARPVVGVSSMMLVGPVMLVGAVTLLMLWYFSLGSVTGTELRAMFLGRRVEIDPQIIEEVVARVGISPVWRTAPAWAANTAPAGLPPIDLVRGLPVAGAKPSIGRVPRHVAARVPYPAPRPRNPAPVALPQPLPSAFSNALRMNTAPITPPMHPLALAPTTRPVNAPPLPVRLTSPAARPPAPMPTLAPMPTPVPMPTLASEPGQPLPRRVTAEPVTLRGRRSNLVLPD